MKKHIVTQDNAIMNISHVRAIKKSHENPNNILAYYTDGYTILAQYSTEAEADLELKRIIEWLMLDEPVYTMTAGE